MPDFGDYAPGDEPNRYSGYGEVDPLAPSVSNGQLTPAQWAEYQAKRRKDAILGVLGVLGGATGLGAAGAAMRGAGAAGAAGSAGPEFGIGAANTGTWASPSAVFGGGPGAIAGAAGGVAGGSDWQGPLQRVAEKTGIFGGMDAKDIMGLVSALSGTIGALNTKPVDNTPTSATTDPQMKAVLDMMMGRMKKAEPLQDSVLSMANGLLPTQYQNGGRG